MQKAITQTNNRVDSESAAQVGLQVLIGSVAAHNGWDLETTLGLAGAGWASLTAVLSAIRRWR